MLYFYSFSTPRKKIRDGEKERERLRNVPELEWKKKSIGTILKGLKHIPSYHKVCVKERETGSSLGSVPWKPAEAIRLADTKHSLVTLLKRDRSPVRRRDCSFKTGGAVEEERNLLIVGLPACCGRAPVSREMMLSKCDRSMPSNLYWISDRHTQVLDFSHYLFRIKIQTWTGSDCMMSSMWFVRRGSKRKGDGIRVTNDNETKLKGQRFLNGSLQQGNISVCDPRKNRLHVTHTKAGWQGPSRCHFSTGCDAPGFRTMQMFHLLSRDSIPSAEL